MKPVVFGKFRDLIYSTSGISLGDNKISLLKARVAKRMRKLGIAEYGDYYQFVMDDKGQQELTHLLNAISTNVTHFFRENHHFQILAKLVKQAGGKRDFKIWSAASSTGEEPYSIAITLLENIAPGSNFEIFASDISTTALSIAESGIYSAEAVQNLDSSLVRSYFQVSKGQENKVFRVKEEVRRKVNFQKINLSTPPYPLPGSLDFIFCRNVMIYFDNHLRKRLLEEFEKLLKPDGYLFVGTSESIFGKSKSFNTRGPSVYQVKGDAKRQNDRGRKLGGVSGFFNKYQRNTLGEPCPSA